MQNFINLGKDEKQQADLFRETEASTMYPPEKNSKTSKSTLNFPSKGNEAKCDIINH